MEVVFENTPPRGRFTARDGQLFLSRADVVRYHASMDIKKAIGNDLHNTTAANSFAHRFTNVATSADVGVILTLAEAVITVHQTAHTTRRGVRKMTVPVGKQLRFRSTDGSTHVDIESAVRADIRTAVHDAIAKLSADSVTAFRVAADPHIHLSALFIALPVKQLSRVVSTLTTFKIELDAAS